MGFKDTMQDLAQTAKEKAQTQMQAAQDKRAIQAQAKLDDKNNQAQLANVFSPTNDMGDVIIDSNNRLFKVRHASAKATKKSGAGMMAVKGLAAVYTLGASVAIEHAMKPDDRIFYFDDLIGYELIEDSASVSGGGVGAALAGGLLFGAAGGIAGAVVGGKKVKGAVENMFLQIKLNDMNMPSLMITFIAKRTKKKSGAYRNALSSARETMACLDLIIRDVDQRNSSSLQTQQVEVVEVAAVEPAVDVADQLERLASLYERGVLTAEEFAVQKAKLLG